MRKYQQLVLLVVSCISLIVLLIYKSENNRLKYVLHVVNFFGRKDAAFFGEFENITTENSYFNHPLPTWQSIDTSFHAYAAYWLDGQEPTAMVDVVGKHNANVLFTCYIQFENGLKQKGKFRFQPWGQKWDTSAFDNYIFFCQLHDKSAHSQVESVQFIGDGNDNSYSGIPLDLRMLKTLKTSALQIPTVCLDLTTAKSEPNQRHLLQNDRYFTQFFLHHKALGIKQFLIYNSNALPSHYLRIFKKYFIQYTLLPFNFPYAITDATVARIRKIVQLDCSRRSAVLTNYSIVLAPNEFVYAKSVFNTNDSILHHAHANNKPVDLHIGKTDICLDAQKPLLMDNTLYDGSHKEDRTSVLITMSDNEQPKKEVELPTNVAFVHVYAECQHIGEDGLSDWRHRLRADFLNFLLQERKEMSMIIK